MHFTFKNPSLKKKKFLIHQSVTEVCILDSEIHNSKKSIPDPSIHNKIRLPDSAIQKVIIYAKFASGTSPHPENKNIQFWIDESVTHSQIPIFSNHSALFRIKGQGQFRDLESCGGAGRKM